MEPAVENLGRIIWSRLPQKLHQPLRATMLETGLQLFVAGGTVRDVLLQRDGGDLDFFVPGSSREFGHCLLRNLGGGSFIDLSVPEEETARVVWRGIQLDFSSPRLGAECIEEDLLLRDFTINSMAVELSGDPCSAGALLDPADGLADLKARVVRHLDGSFAADPLRMLRGYRFAACLGFQLAPETVAQVAQDGGLIERVAAERVDYELTRIFQTGRAAEVLQQMVDHGLLCYILPELFAGHGVAQPEFHHLDVMDHQLCALAKMEDILADPTKFYPGGGARLAAYLADDQNRLALKWAALLHDIGKPQTKEIRAEDGRVTFYRHDEHGVAVFQNIADRLRWSKSLRQKVASLIGAHMHPFHLCNVQREGQISKKAALKLHRRVGEEMPGLFLLAMSDSLASEGEKKPPEMEAELRVLLRRIDDIYDHDISPVVQGPRLVSGFDIMAEFGLEAGPFIGEILDALELCRVEEGITDKGEALAWIGSYLNGRKDCRK